MLLAVVLSQGNPNRNVQTYLTNATASVSDPVSDHRSMVRPADQARGRIDLASASPRWCRQIAATR
jgi:hypothetical protein